MAAVGGDADIGKTADVDTLRGGRVTGTLRRGWETGTLRVDMETGTLRGGDKDRNFSWSRETEPLRGETEAELFPWRDG